MSDLTDLYENKYDTSIEEDSNKFKEIQKKIQELNKKKKT